MVPHNLSKDIEAEIIFFSHLSNNNGGAVIDSGNHDMYFIFDEVDMWEVKLWQVNEEEDLPIGVPVNFFVEFEFPQSLSGKLMAGKEFEIWKGQVIGKGTILELVNLDARAQENIEHIVKRTKDEVFQILAFNKSLFGEPEFNNIDELFYQKLKIVLEMEKTENYLWLWEKPHRLHTFLEFKSPKHIPKTKRLLPDIPEPIWFLVDIDILLSGWYLYNATFTSLEQLLEKYKFSQYYIAAKDFSWLIRKIDKRFIAIGNEVEHKLKQFKTNQG